MSTLTKQTITTVIPGSAGYPGDPGAPARPAYCSTVSTPVSSSASTSGSNSGANCRLVPNPSISFVKVPLQRCHYEYPDGALSSEVQVCENVDHFQASGQYGGVSPSGYFITQCGAPSGGSGGRSTETTTHTTKTLTTCYPAYPGRPPTPPVPPTAAQTIINKQEGWNSSSRSLATIDTGQYFPFTPAVGLMGAFVGFGPAGMDANPPNAFTHGVLVDLYGVRVYEGGVNRYSLRGSYSGNAVIRIARNLDNSITYYMTDGYTTSYTSAAQAPLGDLYAYAKLYSGGDTITKTECVGDIEGIEINEQITFSGSGELRIGFPVMYGSIAAGEILAGIRFTGEGTLSAGGVVTTAGGAIVQPHPMAMMFSGVGALLGYSSGANGATSLPALLSLGGDYQFGIAEGWLPPVESDGTGGFYIPPTPTRAEGWLPLLTSWGLVLESCPGDGDASLPALISLGGDYQYGFAQSWLPALDNFGVDGDPLDMVMLDAFVALDNQSALGVGVLVLLSDGQLQSVYTDQMSKLFELLGDMLAADAYTLLGTFNLSFSSAAFIQSVQTLVGVAGAAVDGSARVWVVNMDTGASSQYDNYGFTSYFTRDGMAYGLAQDGIYLLQGSNDAGADIDAVVDLGSTAFGAPVKKRLPSVYVAVTGEKMILKVATDGSGDHYYEMRSASAHLGTHRVDVGRGLHGVEWRIELLNQDGEDFDLSSLEFKPLTTQRRI